MTRGVDPWGTAAWTGARLAPAEDGGVITDPANPEAPGWSFKAQAGRRPWAAFAWGGGVVAPSMPEGTGGIRIEVDPSTASVYLAPWWAGAPYVRITRVVGEDRQVVRGADPLELQTATRTNFCTNPSFETNTNGWLAGANTTLARTVGTTLEGTAFGRFTATAAGAINLTAPARVPLAPFGVAFALKLSGQPSGALTITVSWQNALAQALPSSTATIATGNLAPYVGRWDRVPVQTIIPPAGAAVGVLTMAIAGNAANATADLDAAIFEEGDDVTGDYFDGDGLTNAWTGTPHGSASTLATEQQFADREAPLDIPFHYEITNPLSGFVISSQPVVLASNDHTWLYSPSNGMLIDAWVAAEPGANRKIQRGVFPVLGRANPVAVSAGTRQSSEGELEVITTTFGDRDRLWAALGDGEPLLLRAPARLGHGPGEWLSVGDVTMKAPGHGAWEGVRMFSLPFQVVDSPAFPIGELLDAPPLVPGAPPPPPPEPEEPPVGEPEEPPPTPPPTLSPDSIYRTTFEEMAYEITSTAENSRKDWYHTDVYGYIEDIDDDRGYTAGIVGFCSGTGDMLDVVQRYVQIKPTGNQLAPYLDELTTLANEGMSGSAGSRADSLLGATYRNLWSSLAVSDPLFRQAQRDLKESMYWRDAFNTAVADGVQGLGLHILYDILVNHGPGNDSESFGGIVAAARTASKPPSQGGTETGYLNALINKRSAVLTSWGDNPSDGRVAAHRALLNTGNLKLVTPFSWSMYSEPFSIQTRPELPLEARRPGDVQPGTPGTPPPPPPPEEPPPPPPPEEPPPPPPTDADSIWRTTFEEMAYEITSTAENSRLDWYHTSVYSYIEDIGDGRGYTAGIVGWCSATGDMLELIEHYVVIKPNNNQMAQYLDELETLAEEGEGGSAGSRANSLLGAPFRNLWANLAVNDALFRQAQRDERERLYWRPAFNTAVDDEVGPLGLAILYDISVNHGQGDDPESFGGIVDAARAAKKPPSQGGAESAYLTALVNKRSAVLTSWGDNPPDGRVAAEKALIATGNLLLHTPFSWNMYGDPFTISTRPELPAEARRPGNVQPGG